MKLTQLKEIMHRGASRGWPGGAVTTYRWDGLLSHVVTVFDGASRAIPNPESSLELECGIAGAQAFKVRFTDGTEEAEVERWLAHEVDGLTIADLVGVTAWRLEQAEARIAEALDALDDSRGLDWADIVAEVGAILRGEA
jgi:hypothetical protein